MQYIDRLNVGKMIFEDKINRRPYAFGVWLATLQAQRMGISKLKVFEFGVAQGLVPGVCLDINITAI